jgi:RimJ/RimL family protein N-acetyltransferase
VPSEPPGTPLELKRIRAEELADPRNAYLAAEIQAYWGTTRRFLRKSCGYCVLDGDNLVSWCYVQAYGHGSQTIDIWTAPSHRCRGLGTLVGAAVIDESLAEGYTPFWICDKANVASRTLAKRLGFHYKGDIDLVDIPFQPYSFYVGLAQHFFLPQGEHRQAAEAYERAFSMRHGEAEDYYQAALAWALAGKQDRAQKYLQKAIGSGWTDMEEIAAEPAFTALRRSTVQDPDYLEN